MTDEARERLITAICLAPDEEFSSKLLERTDLEAHEKRLLLYRRLVRGTLEGTVRRLLPRTVACLEGCGAFDREMSAFLAEAGARTHYLRDIGSELVRWGVGRWTSSDFPPCLADLARYEVLEFDVAIASPGEAPAAQDELALDRAVVFEPTARLAHFAHAVHEDDDPPAARPVSVLVFRDREHAVHAREIAPDVAPVLERLLAGAPLARAVRGGGDAAPIDDALLAKVAEALGALAEEGVLLGAAHAP